jgi:general secretion pathway protein F
MPDFTYEALAATGQRAQGTLTAGSEREVLAMLDARGLFPVKVAPARAGGGASFHLGGGIKTRHTTAFYSQLADLLHSGVPLLKSLDILENQSTSPALAQVLREVRAAVADGTSLADAMGQHPRAFNELAVSMVRAGQEGGFLEDVLRRIADFNEAQEDLKSRVVGALAYPAFLAIIGFLVLNVLVIFFVPRFESLFTRLQEKGELPWLTTMLLAVSHGIQRNALLAVGGLAIVLLPLFKSLFTSRQTLVGMDMIWWLVGFGIGIISNLGSVSLGVFDWTGVLIVGTIVGTILGVGYWARTPGGRLMLDAWKLRIPIVGKIYLHFALARFTRLMGTLLKNGIPILQALRIAKDTTGNRVLITALEKSAENITGGQSLAAPLRACKYFPRDIVEMIAVAEESNTLDKVLIDTSESLEKRTMRQLDLFVRLLEPLMLLVMASCVLVVIAGLLLPIFKMSSTVRG